MRLTITCDAYAYDCYGGIVSSAGFMRGGRYEFGHGRFGCWQCRDYSLTVDARRSGFPTASAEDSYRFVLKRKGFRFPFAAPLVF